jgi:glycine cleavage system H protein
MVHISYEMLFSPDHVWIYMQDEFIGICGITKYCLEEITDVVFVNFPEINIEVKIGERIGVVESHTELFPILSPVSGRITEVNRELEFNLTLINTDPQGGGWICKIDIKEPHEFLELMDNETYINYIESHSWRSRK